jgi:hypothetical protein
MDFDGDGMADYAVLSGSGASPDPEAMTQPGNILTPKHTGKRIAAGLPRPIIERSKDASVADTYIWNIRYSSSLTDFTVVFGTSDDFFVPGQYTSDSKTDMAIWRYSTQEFIVRPSEGGPDITYNIGNSQYDDPTVVGDYDGDGIDDPCVFTGTQWIYRSSMSGTNVTVSFGQVGDFPCPGDFNGDGRNDFGVQRAYSMDPQIGYFLVDYNGDGVSDGEGTFGYYNNVITPGNYDGDAATDFAIADVTRYPGIHWTYISSQTGVMFSADWGDPSIGWQAQGDYDGDGKDDITVWHSDPTGTFYARRSSDLTLEIQSWGSSADYPVAYYQSH